jgi:DNA (cytosine-5)-methyltransferase 1
VGRPRLLDLFCGAGGCSVGYHRAGFDVIGVDLKAQPNYPYEFIHDDALAVLDRLVHGGTINKGWRLEDFDVIHASPPCQAFTSARVIHGNEHPDLLTPCRSLLERSRAPWVIENVPGAPMRKDLVLCGSMFGLRSKHGALVRHRWFELGFPFYALVPPCHHDGPTISVFGHGGHVYHGVEDWRVVMGIDWMTRDELAQAIPPAYTQYIGRALLARLEFEAGRDCWQQEAA